MENQQTPEGTENLRRLTCGHKLTPHQEALAGLEYAKLLHHQEANAKLVEALKYARRFLNDSADKAYIDESLQTYETK